MKTSMSCLIPRLPPTSGYKCVTLTHTACIRYRIAGSFLGVRTTSAREKTCFYLHLPLRRAVQLCSHSSLVGAAPLWSRPIKRMIYRAQSKWSTWRATWRVSRCWKVRIWGRTNTWNRWNCGSFLQPNVSGEIKRKLFGNTSRMKRP